MLQVLFELVKKDFLLFVADRRAMFITFCVPIAIASFMGPLMSGSSSSDNKPKKASVLVVDQERSAMTKSIVASLKASTGLEVTEGTSDDAAKKVKSGDFPAAIVLPKGFSDRASKAMMGGSKPDIKLITDPSKSIEGQVVRGYATQAIMSGVVKEVSGQEAAGTLPFNFTEESQGGNQVAAWSGSAHAFAGMGVQALFFGALESAMMMMRDRRNGIWSRLRASPVSPWLLIFARLIGAALIASLTYSIVIGVGMLLFGFRITGSMIGFLLIALSLGAMTASTGLIIAALGKTEQQSRGLSILVILSFLMLGGAWFPAFLLPAWIQPVSLATPVRWAVDGVDKMTFRGEGLIGALPTVGVLMAYAIVLTLIAGKRFRWEAETK